MEPTAQRKSTQLRAKIDALKTKRDMVRAEMKTLADRETLSDGENEHFFRLTRQCDKLNDEIDELDMDARRAFAAEVQQGLADGSVRQIPGSVALGHEDFYRLNADVMGAALRSLDRLSGRMPTDRVDAMEHMIRSNMQAAAEFDAHASDAYQRAFWKLLTHGEGRAHLAMLEDERAAMAHALNVGERAMSEGVTTAGGFGVPVVIDPSIMMSAQGSANPILQLGRIVDVNTNVWKGVSSAGVSWSFDAEAATVSDDSPTLAQPSVTVFMARGFIPYSIEVEQDYAGFQTEMARLLDEGYNELLSDKLARGSGSGEPRGIITALDANTNVEVVVTTDGSFGSEDIFKVWKALPERFRANASWVMSVDVANRIKQFESGNGAIRFPEIANGQLMTRSLYTSSYFPDHTGTTGAENKLVVGDFRNYLVARRAGMRIELVPMLFDVTNNRPTGQRGFFAWGRVGGNSVVDEGFRLLQNQ